MSTRGRLSNARTVERMTLLSGELGQRYGFFPRMNYKPCWASRGNSAASIWFTILIART